MHIWLEVLIAWAVIAPPVCYFAGSHLKKIEKAYPLAASQGMAPGGLDRTEQHKYDAAHNPNYRGGYKP